MRLSSDVWATFYLYHIQKLDNKSYFEAGRSPRKRSLLFVNEHFEGKPDAERALLYNFSFSYFIFFNCSIIHFERAVCCSG